MNAMAEALLEKGLITQQQIAKAEADRAAHKAMAGRQTERKIENQQKTAA